jgi:hypothetical protein
MKRMNAFFYVLEKIHRVFFGVFNIVRKGVSLDSSFQIAEHNRYSSNGVVYLFSFACVCFVSLVMNKVNSWFWNFLSHSFLLEEKNNLTVQAIISGSQDQQLNWLQCVIKNTYERNDPISDFNIFYRQTWFPN